MKKKQVKDNDSPLWSYGAHQMHEWLATPSKDKSIDFCGPRQKAESTHEKELHHRSHQLEGRPITDR